MLAASNNRTNLVRLLSGYDANLNLVESTNGCTALIWAAKQGHQVTGIALLNHGADTQHKDHTDTTVKDWPIQGGFEKTVDLPE